MPTTPIQEAHRQVAAVVNGDTGNPAWKSAHDIAMLTTNLAIADALTAIADHLTDTENQL
jgi:hypothetical protein